MSAIAISPPLQLDPGRITAGAGAIALNALLLLLLLVPIAAPPKLAVAPPEVIDYVRIAPPEVEPVPPIRVPITPSTTRPERRPVEQAAVQPSTETTDVPQPGDIVVPPGDEPVVGPPADPVGPPDNGEPMQGAHLEYASAPPPAYPRQALLDGLAGTVMLTVLVDVDGRPLEVSIQRSSGHRALDAAARRQVLSKWRFRPAIRAGRPVQAIGVVPVEFKLD